MPGDFFLSTARLTAVARRMARGIREGMAAEDAEVACLPTYVPVERIPRNGRLLVLDLGGTHIRCAQTSLSGSELLLEKGPVREALIRSGQTRLSQEAFLDRLASVVQGLAPEPELAVGYCFSYPARPSSDGDAVLLRWTKEFFVSDTVGRKVGEMLCRRLSTERRPFFCRSVRVINDTVAALLAGMAAAEADGHIGLVVGTGTNMALAARAEDIPKIIDPMPAGRVLPVNLESGNFFPPHLTEWDAALDAGSENPGGQRLEKAVSGRYLARLAALCMPDTDLDAGSGAAGVFEKAFGGAAGSTEEKELARAVVDRSARLVAASLAGAILFLADLRPLKSFSITAEGGLFHGHPVYRETVEHVLEAVLAELDRPGLSFEIRQVPHATLLGAAIAGLSGQEEEK